MQPGSKLGPYEVVAALGRGGMGEVYRAYDPRLEREIALKLLPPEVAGSRDRLVRFEREAKALAAVRHPGVVTVFSVEESDGVHFLTMELVEGQTLGRAIPAGGMELTDFLGMALQLTSALAAAHKSGIVHRDIKPGNIMVDDGGSVTLLDFGLVKFVPTEASADDPTMTVEQRTAAGAVMGTWHYMSPEQAKGEEVGAASDVFSLGSVFYEMLTGKRPFDAVSQAETLAFILHRRPPPLSELRPDVPAELASIVEKCLEKSASDRFASGVELDEAVRKLAPSSASHLSMGEGVVDESPSSSRRLAPVVVALVLLALGIGGWLWSRRSRENWLQDFAVPRVEELKANGEMSRAFVVAQEAVRRAPNDPEAAALLRETSLSVSVITDPPGARISYRDYDHRDAEWVSLGESPIGPVPMPNGAVLLRAEKEGFAPIERLFYTITGEHYELTLSQVSSAPPGMEWIDVGPVKLWSYEPVSLDPFWLDRYEVTNREYQAFVDAGGYRDPEYWKHPFEEGGRELSFDEAMSRFLDRTGQPGPASWGLGTFDDGEENLPVRGVSWYEAAAYAEFVGKSLPTIYHWRAATPFSPFDTLVRKGNLASDAVVEVGASEAISQLGVHDLAGNVAEWVFNTVGDRRYLLGSAWSDPLYTFANDAARPPMERAETFGFRCALYPEGLPPGQLEPIELERFDFADLAAVSDEVFEVYRRLLAYDATPLEPKIEEVDESPSHWRLEKVSFAAAYGDERVLGLLFLPRRTRPPYQTVVFFPSSGALRSSTSDRLTDLHVVDFVPRSGRALFYPIYKGTYERRGERSSGPAGQRQRWMERVQDLGRSVDYLLTRDDIDPSALAYLGLSLGSEYGAIMTSIETRFAVSVLVAGGFDDLHMLDEPAEIQPWHYAPRVHVPTLMINGDLDFGLPVETGQKPLFDSLGVPDDDKRHVVLEGGHLPNDRLAIIRETLAWLDRYLGPVTASTSSASSP